MTLTQILAAFYRRGFEDMNDAGAGVTEATRWANQVYLEACEQERWPFLAATSSGAAPLTISDLGAVESVRDTGQNSVALAWRDRRDLTDAYSDLTTAGSPRWFYIDNGVIKTWPVGGTLTVLYWKVPVELSAGGDTPIIPARFHELIVTGMAKRGHMQKQNYEAAGAEQAEYDRILDLMRSSLLDQQDVSSDLISITAGAEDW